MNAQQNVFFVAEVRAGRQMEVDRNGSGTIGLQVVLGTASGKARALCEREPAGRVIGNAQRGQRNIGNSGGISAERN